MENRESKLPTIMICDSVVRPAIAARGFSAWMELYILADRTDNLWNFAIGSGSNRVEGYDGIASSHSDMSFETLMGTVDEHSC